MSMGGRLLIQDSPVQHRADSSSRKALSLAVENKSVTLKRLVSILVKLSALFAQKLWGTVISVLYQIGDVKEAIRIIGCCELPGMGMPCGHRNLL